MPAIDDRFLDAHGLAALPAAARAPLIDRLRVELERRVGIRICDGLDPAQIEEFTEIVDGHPRALACFLARHRPGWQTDATYLEISAGLGPDRPLVESVVEYASQEWLEVNRPDFRDCVAAAFEELVTNVSSHADGILAAAARPVVSDAAPTR